MENNYFRIIANPYLLKKKIQKNNPYETHLSKYLQYKYYDINRDMIDDIIIIIDNYYKDKIIRNTINDLIDSVIKFDNPDF